MPSRARHPASGTLARKPPPRPSHIQEAKSVKHALARLAFGGTTKVVKGDMHVIFPSRNEVSIEMMREARRMAATATDRTIIVKAKAHLYPWD